MTPDADAAASARRADPFAPLTSDMLAVGDGHELYV
jgi:proline iminopeptidase